MKTIKIAILITGILVAVLALNTIAQVPMEKDIFGIEKEVLTQKNELKEAKDASQRVSKSLPAPYKL